MKTVATIAELRALLDAERAAGRTVGFVPTMGYLHDGHASLMRAARIGTDVVVASIFVNPLQFGAGEDLDAYPRDLDRDTAVASDAGVDLLFVPSVDEMYPRPVLTTVSVAEVSAPLEGAARPTHFAGVATVVAKLFSIVGPCRAYFGAKDFQQVAVVRRMAADLSLPVDVVACPTLRELDGLAMSSRNVYLTPAERAAAPVVYAALAQRGGRHRGGGAGPGGGARPHGPDHHGRAPGGTGLRRGGRCRLVHRPRPAHRGSSAARGRALRASEAHRQRGGDRVTAPTAGGSEVVRRRMLKSKIHRAVVTDANLHYVGSVTIDPDLLEAADILEHEQVAVVDIDNGARFETYAIAGRRGSGDLCLNGAAARLVQPGDRVIVISYADYEDAELERYEPRVVHVDTANRQVDAVSAELLAAGSTGSAPHRYVEVPAN